MCFIRKLPAIPTALMCATELMILSVSRRAIAGYENLILMCF